MYDEVSVGDRFGHYTVIAEAAPAITLSKRRRWLCRCDCGNERIVEEPNLRHGKSTNCGCVRYRNMVGNKYNSRENAHHKDRLHHIWVAMRSRCNSKTNTSYHNYGAKGVSVCAEWDDYEVFKLNSLKTWLWHLLTLGNGSLIAVTDGVQILTSLAVKRTRPTGNSCRSRRRRRTLTACWTVGRRERETLRGYQADLRPHGSTR